MVSLMFNCLVEGLSGIGMTGLVLASVGITVFTLDECRIYRHTTDTIRVGLCGAVAVPDARLWDILSEPIRCVDDLFNLLEIFVHIPEFYAVFVGKRRRFVVGNKREGRSLTVSWGMKD
jgi:hypothetical protein